MPPLHLDLTRLVQDRFKILVHGINAIYTVKDDQSKHHTLGTLTQARQDVFTQDKFYRRIVRSSRRLLHHMELIKIGAILPSTPRIAISTK